MGPGRQNVFRKSGSESRTGYARTGCECRYRRGFNGVYIEPWLDQRKDPSKFGLDAFDAVDITKGIFEIEYTSGMLTNIGPLNASLQLVPPGEGRPIESNNFKLTVKNSAINASAIQGETSFSTLENALVEVNGWNARIDVVEQEFKDRADALDGAYPVRLTAAEQSVAAVEAQVDLLNRGLGETMTTMASLLAAYPTGDTRDHIVAGNIAEVDTLTVTGVPTTAGNITVTLNGVAKTVAVDPAVQTTTDLLAALIRGTVFTGWITGGTNSVITFTATISETKSAPTFIAGTTGVTAAFVRTAIGEAPNFHRYFWNGTAWADGGMYQAFEAADNSIVLGKMRFPYGVLLERDKIAINKSTNKISVSATYVFTDNTLHGISSQADIDITGMTGTIVCFYNKNTSKVEAQLFNSQFPKNIVLIFMLYSNAVAGPNSTNIKFTNSLGELSIPGIGTDRISHLNLRNPAAYVYERNKITLDQKAKKVIIDSVYIACGNYVTNLASGEYDYSGVTGSGTLVCYYDKTNNYVRVKYHSDATLPVDAYILFYFYNNQIIGPNVGKIKLLDVTRKVVEHGLSMAELVYEHDPFLPSMTGINGTFTKEVMRKVFLDVNLTASVYLPDNHIYLAYISTDTTGAFLVVFYSDPEDAGLNSAATFIIPVADLGVGLKTYSVTSNSALVSGGYVVVDTKALAALAIPISTTHNSGDYRVAELSYLAFNNVEKQAYKDLLTNAELLKYVDLGVDYSIEGFISDPSGALGSITSWWVSQPVPVDLLSRLFINGAVSPGATAYNIAFYTGTSMSTFIAGSGIKDPQGGANYKFAEVAIPPTAKYARFCVLKSRVDSGTQVKAYALSKDYVNRQTSVAMADALNSSNLVDITSTLDIKTGFFFNIGTGALQTNGDWSVSEKTLVDARYKYYLTMLVQSGSYAAIVYYDSTFGVTGVLDNTGISSLTDYELLFPTGTKYFAITTSNSTISSINLKAQLGSFFTTNLPSSAENTFVLPKYIDMVAGHQCNIYLDTVSNIEGIEKDIVVASSVSLPRRADGIQFTPVEGQTDIPATFKKLSVKSQTEYQSVVTMRTASPSGGTGQVKNIMIIGDSLIDSGVPVSTIQSQLAADGDYTINMLGTRGSAPAKHEGRGSWTWYKYLYTEDADGKNNAFLYSGVLDFQQYCIDNGYSGIDYVVISLGTNDVTQGSTVQTSSSIATLIGYAKVFIDALLADYPNCKIAIGLPAIGAPYFMTAATSAKIFRTSMQMLNKAYIDTFDDGKYHANVTTVAHGLWTHRKLSYPHTLSAASSRMTETEMTYSDGIHPTSAGYSQWGDAYYAKIRAFLAGRL